nr:EOG090X0LTN [Chydorus sphaericus]
MDEPLPPPVPRNFIHGFASAVYSAVDRPVTWFRENVVVPNREDYVWYHRKFRRVPTFDECYTDDLVCRFEAQAQFNRDKKVDGEIIAVLRNRYKECVIYEMPDQARKCEKMRTDFEDASTNFCIKYGDLGPKNDVQQAYMKQKHRMIWERRHGPVGSGMKKSEDEILGG